MRYTVMLLLLLAACKKDLGIQPRRTAGSDSADQVYSGMTTEIVRDGVRQSHVYADSAWAYQARQLVDLTRMTVTMFDSSGAKISTIVADKGIYYTRQQSLDARGHVVATSSGGKVLKTEHLIYDRDKNQISSDTFFTSTSPKGNISGAHFVADPGFKNVDINKMKGLQKGKGIALPGQQGGGAP
jgi:LPS export ABC transporter protein LptC